MIAQVKNAAQYAQFDAVARLHIATKAQMTAQLALFGHLPASGWQFYLSERNQQVGALALRGTSARMMGATQDAFDREELESFLSFLGIQSITITQPYMLSGFPLRQQLFVYTLAAGDALVVPPLPKRLFGRVCEPLHLDREPSVSAILPLLWGDDTGDDTDATTAMRENYYADSCVARNGGMAEFWLVRHGEKAIFTLAASAVVGRDVYLSAGETIEAYRGQGIGGHYIASMANEYAAKGYDVCFVCEAARCHFYNRLGFTQSGVLYQYERRLMCHKTAK